jgi:Ala-tRNA(Pro) deacylase
MFVSQTVVGYLERSGVDYDLVVHPHSATSLQTARAARIEPHKLAKAVLLSDEEEFWLAVIPASGRVNRWALERLVDVDSLSLAAEEDMPVVFRDCERGALPIVGPAFGVRTALDDALLDADEVYFEAGDHEHLVHMTQEQFQRLMAGHPHGPISHPSHAHLHPRARA